ncbi:Hypothetical predicted protein [Lecanosticta acicola]|uniref:WLM domain-containing protein n=1 Tax=Lecanosticta acicola TaxID=111012 RepID=A0AAI9E9N5_9PEZI|nr:Hypothetical predicted protein [Lecanosticta acicola]
MPLGFERLNERKQRPNPLINFIKPKEGPDQATAEEFLSRIAAQCYPVMKKHHISVMALEEYEPNPEFLGRNFNAGEVIQLVLKDRQGRWLSMKFVQMVMMHELAHCKQMNHSRFFWNVRNEYAKQMEDLWKDKYTGEGIWGRGRGLQNGAFVSAAPPDNSQIPEHLCGGSYRRRGRKRKRGGQGGDQPEKLTYAERQQRRIARKFGKHGDGESLGEDDLVRGALESSGGGKRGHGKPRVANSKRGRELRAAAALARFEQTKSNPPERIPELEDDLDSETESEWEDDALSAGKNSAVISDGQGRDLIKVCGDGEDDEEGANKEMDELRMLSTARKGKAIPWKPAPKPARGEEGHEDSETESETDEPSTSRHSVKPAKASANSQQIVIDDDTASEAEDNQSKEQPKNSAMQPSQAIANDDGNVNDDLPSLQKELLRELDTSNAVSQTSEAPSGPTPTLATGSDQAPSSSICPICSLENDQQCLSCIACSNVLRPKLVPNCWRCKRETCKESKYVNAGDAGRCGLCGAQKPKQTTTMAEGTNGRPMGITRAEVLRWD